MDKTMDNNWFGHLDAKVGFASGAICGVLKMLDIYLLSDPYSIVLIKVLFTAILGGFGGVLGKHLFSYFIKKWKEIFKNKNKQL